MKKFISIIILCFSFNLLANDIVLDPGSKISVSASQKMTISCSGSPVSSNAEKGCRVLKRGEIYSNGKTCYHDFCAEVFQFGSTLSSKTFYNSSDAVNWCVSRS